MLSTSDIAHSFTMVTLPPLPYRYSTLPNFSLAVAQLKKSVASQKSTVKKLGVGHVSDDYDSEASNGHNN